MNMVMAGIATKKKRQQTMKWWIVVPKEKQYGPLQQACSRLSYIFVCKVLPLGSSQDFADDGVHDSSTDPDNHLRAPLPPDCAAPLGGCVETGPLTDRRQEPHPLGFLGCAGGLGVYGVGLRASAPGRMVGHSFIQERCPSLGKRSS